jgi:hypothetical protein
MLRNASAIKGYTIAATDGRIGTVSDILFDDSSWRVRWVVVDTGNWLPGRKVLLPLSALGRLNENGSEFAVKLTMQQVKDSPESGTDRPVSRQIEANIYGYYGWQPYWGTDMLMGGYGYGGGVAGALPVIEARQRAEDIATAGASDNAPPPAQRSGHFRLSYSRHGWRNRPSRRLHCRGHRLEHSQYHCQNEELVARQDRRTRAVVDRYDRLDR